ncbi:MAG: reprolysin-like metallopeptidase, partial [Pyrinomonadaceae bacterium]
MMCKFLVVIVMIAGSSFQALAQENIWSANSESTDSFIKDKAVARATFPREFRLFNLNVEPLRQQLFTIVDGTPGRSTVISLPNADGFLERFEIYEASNFDAELQAKFPEIRAFSGRGITDKYAMLKLSISPEGIQTTLFRAESQIEIIEPFSQDRAVYAVFRSRRDKGQLPWTCSTQEKNMFSDISSQVSRNLAPESNTGNIKTMRLAQSCNGEYSNFFGAFNSSQVNLVLAAFNGTLTRTNGVYEKDLALHLNLIPQTTAVIYYDPATDPYTTLGAWNNQLAATLAANIGEANYDIGHMFGASGGGGNAGCIGCVCVDGQKGRGITSPADAIPQGDNFDIDYVAHEVGHQMGGNHTFSHASEGTGRNKEVGSGITVMGYAGITGQDVAPHSIDVFHETSIEQIQANMAPKPCPITTNLPPNSTPVITAIGPFTIPISTAFALTGIATDAQGDPLTYNWEQSDNSTTTGAGSVASPGKLTGPNWLTFPSTISPTRSFPRLSTILAGLFVTPPFPGGDAGANIEALSSVSRTLNFRLTVRDNVPYVPGVSIGQTQFSNTVVTVTNTAGPFRVTGPIGGSFPGGSSQTVTWDVANTNTGTVNVANVKISISFDGGLNFPVVLAASTANDGSESLTIPNTGTTAGRIKVESIGNVFFDISDANFSINGPTPTPTPTFTGTSTSTATGTATASPSPTNTNTATNTATATATGTPPPVNTFSNSAPITINDNSAGSPYPSNISVAGLTGNVTKVTVTLTGLGHTFPDDIDVLLVGPGGQNALIMSDAGGDADVTGINLTLDDAAATALPDAGPLVSGTFQPANYVGSDDNFPAPAPVPGGGAALSAFNGFSPNGTWSLYVRDDEGVDVGSISGGWTLRVTTSGSGTPPPTPTFTNTAAATATSTPGGGSTIYAVDLRNLDFDRLTTTNTLATRVFDAYPAGQSAYFGGDFAGSDFTRIYAINDFNDTLNTINVT